MTAPQLENVEDIYPLTPMQEGMLFHTVSAPGSGVFVDQICVELGGPIDGAVLRAAWLALVERHQALRTAFVWDGLDQPLQIVRQSVTPEWTDLDWSGLPGDVITERLEARLSAERTRGFELTDAPLSRFTFVRESPDRATLVWTFHHLIVDGWSAQVLLSELQGAIRALEAGAAPGWGPPFRYRDFVAWREQIDHSAAERHWRGRLAGISAPVSLAPPERAPVAEGGGHRTDARSISRASSDRLREMASAAGITLNSAILGAWALLLSRWTREREVLVGATSSGRPLELDGIEQAVGLFINTLPVRIAVDPERPVDRWLREIQSVQLEDRAHEQASLSSVQRWSDVPAGQPLFESLFVFENYPPRDQARSDSGMRIGDLRFLEQSNYPLAVLALPGDEIELSVVFDASVYASSWIEGVLDALVVVLERFASEPGQRLGDVSITSGSQAAPSAPLPGWEPGIAIHRRIEAAVDATPDATAVIASDGTLSYRELDNAGNALANALAGAGVAPGALVGVYAERSRAMVIGVLGVLKAGGAYVPLDPAYPSEHIDRLIVDDGIGVVVVGPGLRAPGGATAISIDPDARAPDRSVSAVSGADPAYVIHTSGSTGRPKGVVVSHDNLCHSTLARQHFYTEPVGRFLLLSSFAFDSSVAGLFWTLTTGGAIVLPGAGADRDVDALAGLIRRHAVTHLLGLPTLYEALLDEAGGSLGSLKTAIVAGEACPPRLVATHGKLLPECALFNEYGPTEGTVWCSAHRVRATDVDRVPIGRETPGSSIRLLDAYLHPVPDGFPGELCVCGPQVATGYLGEEAGSVERFITSSDGERLYRTGDLACRRPDGSLLFLGRVDRQLKVRGHRIEAEAVEAVLRDEPAIADAAVIAHAPRSDAGARLLAYLRLESEDADLPELRSRLRGRLPEFMVPDRLIPIASIPALPNGKTDYGALPDPGTETDAAGFVAPRTDRERALATLWQELLGVDRVSVHDDYFALGGDSILSIRMVSRARQQGLAIQTAQVADHPTVAALASVAGDLQERHAEQAPIRGEVSLGAMQRWFLDLDLDVPWHWNLSNVFEVPASLDRSAIEAAVSACVAHHDMLRAGFESTGGGWRQTIGEPAPCSVEVIDAGDSAVIDEAFLRAQGGLGPAPGGAVRALLVRRPEPSASLLLLAIHHLVVDVVSWQILIEDLEHALAQHQRGEAIVLPPKTAPFGVWTDALRAAVAATPSPATPKGTPPLPCDQPKTGSGTEGEARSVTVTLDRTQTDRLLGASNDAYRTRPEELLLTALGMALAGWTGSGVPAIWLESHGREGPTTVDVTRTIGWFSVVSPFVIPASVGAEIGAVVRATKEARRGIEHGGICEHAGRWLLGRDPGVDDPEVLFNYLGRVRTGDQGGLLRWISSDGSNARDPRNRRTTPLEIVASVRRSVLTVEWWYAPSLHRAETIERVASSFRVALETVMSHCLAEGSGAFTPSDFPDAGLDQDELDRFMDTLG